MPVLRIAVAAYLSRFRSLSGTHAESDLRAFLGWCAERRVDPLAASRPQIELYVRWMQEVRRLKPSTTSRRMSIVVGFYRTAVIDGLLGHSPAEHVRRPHVPAESPTLGLTHLQLEALLTAGRQSPNRCDFALVCLLGLTRKSNCGRARQLGHRVRRLGVGWVLGGQAAPMRLTLWPVRCSSWRMSSRSRRCLLIFDW